MLYHGTALERLPSIQQDGLRPMQRQQVHLTSNEKYAQTVAASTGDYPIVLSVQAGDAFRAGVAFHQASCHVWLTDAVPPQFISCNRN
ncbi:MAG: RNA 2'-phosphotransferase [Planctomycetes bacterium]|nr:RNA 2'-phosphotransferase [Planctomycetota bacterium]